MTLGKRITELRKQNEMSQEALAAAMEVSRQAVSKWETGRCEPDTENLIRLAEILGTDVPALLGASVQEAPPKKKRNPVIWILSILLAVVTGVAILFAVLWLSAASQPEGPQTEASEATEYIHWESVKMYNDALTLRTEIPLTQQEQKILAETVWSFSYTSLPEDAELETVYGGLVIQVEFVKDGTAYTWTFTAHSITREICTASGLTAVHYYEPDENIYIWLKTFL